MKTEYEAIENGTATVTRTFKEACLLVTNGLIEQVQNGEGVRLWKVRDGQVKEVK